MCEMLGIRSQRPMPVERVLEHAELLDEYGLAGFSWGIVWRNESGELQRYRAVEGILRDPRAYKALAGIESTDYLVHLRRPSAMTSIGQVNAQPYMKADAQLAFGHNGDFERHKEFRPRYLDRLEGTSDSEVGFFYYHDLLKAGEDPQQALIRTQKELEGRVNIMVIFIDGTILAYSGNNDNDVYTFEMDGAKMVSTALHSQDDFLFQSVFPLAANIKLVKPRTVSSL